jgi:NAD(P)-dependent dehydrogenase (short-subunit alcohol dehydrogenase family)
MASLTDRVAIITGASSGIGSAASQAGLMGLVQVLATEYGSHGIRVNALVPGGTDTPANVANAPGAALLVDGGVSISRS